MYYRKLIARAVTAAVAGGLVVAGPSWAGTASQNVTVAATVNQVCKISTTGVSFAVPYDPVVTHTSTDLQNTGGADGKVSVTCTKSSTSISVDLDQGGNYASTERHMIGSGTSDLLIYRLYKPSAGTAAASCAFTTLWGSTAGGTAFSATPASWSPTSANDFYICASVPQAQNISADSYSDTVSATVTY